MPKRKAKERQNQIQIDTYHAKGGARMGPWTSHIWRTDPRHLGFLLARYKFCAKMLEGKSAVLEVGCGDAFGTKVVKQTVRSVCCVDFEPLIIEEAKDCIAAEKVKGIDFVVHDMTRKSLGKKFDAVYSLDVIEHIPPAKEKLFMKNICASLKKDAVCLIGTPNIAADKHASAGSRAGHVNLKSGATMRRTLEKYFRNVFIFSMNDELVHTGFSPMAHYLLGMGVGLKKQ